MLLAAFNVFPQINALLANKDILIIMVLALNALIFAVNVVRLLIALNVFHKLLILHKEHALEYAKILVHIIKILQALVFLAVILIVLLAIILINARLVHLNIL